MFLLSFDAVIHHSYTHWTIDVLWDCASVDLCSEKLTTTFFSLEARKLAVTALPAVSKSHAVLEKLSSARRTILWRKSFATSASDFWNAFDTRNFASHSHHVRAAIKLFSVLLEADTTSVSHCCKSGRCMKNVPLEEHGSREVLTRLTCSCTRLRPQKWKCHRLLQETINHCTYLKPKTGAREWRWQIRETYSTDSSIRPLRCTTPFFFFSPFQIWTNEPIDRFY